MENMISERVQFRLARQAINMAAEEVDVIAGYGLGTCGKFERAGRKMTKGDEFKLLTFLRAVVAYECAKRDYRAAVLEYMAKNDVTLYGFARLSGVPLQVLRNLGDGKVARLQRKTTKKLDEVLFSS